MSSAVRTYLSLLSICLADVCKGRTALVGWSLNSNQHGVSTAEQFPQIKPYEHPENSIIVTLELHLFRLPESSGTPFF